MDRVRLQVIMQQTIARQKTEILQLMIYHTEELIKLAKDGEVPLSMLDEGRLKLMDLQERLDDAKAELLP